MKKSLILLLIMILTDSLYAQDMIVTHEGDSINCKITKVKKDNIYFTFMYKNEVRRTLLPLSSLKVHQFNFYSKSEIPNDNNGSYKRNYQRFRVAINGGYSYQLAKVGINVPDGFKNYFKELKSGYHFGGDIIYYFTEYLGVGIKYSAFRTSNKMNISSTNNQTGEIINGIMSNDLTISFIGPTFSTRYLNHNKSNAFHFKSSIGFMGYSDDKKIITDYKITGRTLGIAFDLGYDIGLSKNLSLSVQASAIMGVLYKYNQYDGIKTLEKSKYESLNRADLSIGLVYYGK